MTPLTPLLIGYDQKGLQLDRKPFALPENAFVSLYNAMVWRQRVVRRWGNRILGRLRRVFTGLSLGNSGASPWTINTLWTTLVPPIVPEATAQIEPGSVVITIAAGPDIVFTDQGNGLLTSPTGGNSGTINYLTGVIVLTHTAGAGVATTVNFNYFPGLPVMGIWTRDISNTNDEQTIFWDTKYDYIFSGTGFQNATSTTWGATDSDFFLATNYRGSTPDARLIFETNFQRNATSPMRYWDGAAATWTTFQPIIADVPESAAQSLLYDALILIPYYGRLVALNTWEGTTAGGLGASVNIYNRARFSQIGNPIAADAWRSDQFGKGGFIDAPTNEAIVSATFYKNTLIVHFERTTWQLRYQGEYGLPFIWERISSDFGSESTFSDIVFDNGVLTVGDRAITISSGLDVKRIDEDIPDQVFGFRNAQNGTKRVHGVRDFQNELAYWTYSDGSLERKFPNRVQVYNYRNNTWAIFRDNVTAFGTFQSQTAITWDRTDIYWDDETIYWDSVDTQSLFPYVVSGNQQGYVHLFGETTAVESQPSLSVSAFDDSVSPFRLTVTDHNLENGTSLFGNRTDEVVYLTGMNFVTGGAAVATNINNTFYQVQRISDNVIALRVWDTNTQSWIALAPNAGTTAANYMGGGQLAVLPNIEIMSKDFNPYMKEGKQLRLSYVDVLMDVVNGVAMGIFVFMNASLDFEANSNSTQQISLAVTTPYQTIGSEYLWQRAFTSTYGQFVRVLLSFNNDQMTTMATHEADWTLNAMRLWVKPAGRNVF